MLQGWARRQGVSCIKEFLRPTVCPRHNTGYVLGKGAFPSVMALMGRSPTLYRSF